MLCLHDGWLIYATVGNVKLPFKGTQGMIVTAVIDSNNKLITFFVDGKQIRERNFTIADSDFSKTYPYIDMHIDGDSLSIVKYLNLIFYYLHYR